MVFLLNIENETKQNDNFRKVLKVFPNSELTVMSLKPNEEIGMETHKGDQIIRIEEGKGRIISEGKEQEVEEDWIIVIPAGVEHNVINTGEEDLKLYTIYSPSEHEEGIIHKTKEEALGK